jgi:cytochrome c-type biogenesis protein CcmF
VRRFYHASQQTSTMPDIRSTLNEDLYLVFEGVNQDNGHPILKAHLNALVMWIWMGVWIMLIGTVLALVPNAPAPVRAPSAARLEPVRAGSAVTGD